MLCVLLSFGQAVHAASVSKALTVIYKHEGGLQCSPSDPGNWTSGRVGVGKQGCTKYGIATNTYPRVNIKELSLAGASKLYTRDYWNPLHLSELRSQALATEMLDTAVNCGTGTAANMLLRLVNVFAPAHYKLNGHVNSEQIEWINKYTRSKTNRTTFYKALNVLQGERYIIIMERNPRMRMYSNSWYSRVGQ